MTGTPSKDRAEAIQAAATQAFADADYAETVPEAVSCIALALTKAHDNGFAEGMKRAAEIACSHTTANHVAISDAIFAEIGER